MSSGTLRKRGEVWYGRIRHQGKEFEKSLETGSKTVARERLGKWVEGLKAQGWGERERRSFDEGGKRFIKEHFRTSDRAVASATWSHCSTSLISSRDNTWMRSPRLS